MDQIYKEERFVSRVWSVLGLAENFAAGVKESSRFSLPNKDKHSDVSRTSCVANCNARVFQNTHLVNANSID